MMKYDEMMKNEDEDLLVKRADIQQSVASTLPSVNAPNCILTANQPAMNIYEL